MKIKPSELHFSQQVLEEFDNLREQLLVLFALDKYIEEKQEEVGLAQDQHQELDTLKIVYDKQLQANKYKQQQQALYMQMQQQ